MNIVHQLRERMVSMYGDMYFEKHQANENDPEKYYVVKSSVARMLLIGMYYEFLKNKECTPLESLDEGLKNKYWDVSKAYFPDKIQRLEACKTMYVMDLITGTLA